MNDLLLEYDDVAQYLFERLTSLGYVIETDELLDMTDAVVDLILGVHAAMGGEVVVYEEELEEEDE